MWLIFFKDVWNTIFWRRLSFKSFISVCWSAALSIMINLGVCSLSKPEKNIPSLDKCKIKAGLQELILLLLVPRDMVFKIFMCVFIYINLLSSDDVVGGISNFNWLWYTSHCSATLFLILQLHLLEWVRGCLFLVFTFRFAQFFTSPLVKAEAMEREVLAVDSGWSIFYPCSFQ